jgi:hypothetical protein
VTRAGWFFLVAGCICTGLLGAVLWRGGEYYLLPAARRPLHPRHEDLRSGGHTGLACGLAGSLLLCLNLTYIARKKLLAWRWLGALRAWMAFHIFTGFLGALLILVHSGFLLRSTLGSLAAAALGIAVVTGLIGRYIYAHVPRSLEGRELERAELARRLDANRLQLEREGIDVALLDAPPPEPQERGFLGRLRAVVTGHRETNRHYRRLHTAIRGRPGLRHLLPLARRYTRQLQWQARYSELRALMGSWRFLHRWLALVMLIVAAFHVYLAIVYADLRWPL